MYLGCIALFVVMFTWGGDFLRLTPLWSRNAFFYIPLAILGLSIFEYLNRFVKLMVKKLEDRRAQKALEK